MVRSTEGEGDRVGTLPLRCLQLARPDGRFVHHERAGRGAVPGAAESLRPRTDRARRQILNARSRRRVPGVTATGRAKLRRRQDKRRAERKGTPPPLVGGGWGEGLVGGWHRPTPPPGPLPQGEGGGASFLLGAQRRSNPPPDERPAVRQAGDCFVAARLAMTGDGDDRGWRDGGWRAFPVRVATL